MYRHIARLFPDNVERSDDDVSEERRPDAPSQMSLEEKLALWNVQDLIPIEEQIIQEDLPQPEAREVSAARSFLLESESFQSLLGKMRVAVLTTISRDTALQAITDTVSSRLTSLVPPGYSDVQNAVFKVAWNPLSFFEDQEYPDSGVGTLERVITINGSICDAQALTCFQYMEQTWPTTGVELLRVLDSAIARGRHTIYQCIVLPPTDWCKLLTS